MKTPVLLLTAGFLFFVTGFAQTASANLGQDRKDIEARYGPGKSVAPQEPAEEATTYSWKGMHILVEYWKGLSSSEQFQKTDASIMSEAEITSILASNAESSSWHQASNDVWVRTDKAAVAYTGDNRTALVVQLYGYHVEEKKRSEQANKVDKPKSAAAGATPRTMTRIVSRYISSQTPADSFAAKPKTAYMAGLTYARAEEEDDPEQHIHGLTICVEPDIWMINLDAMQGRHIVDPGPTFEVHNPLMEPDAPGDLPSLEMGKEVEFFQQHSATRLNPQTIDGQQCEALEYKESNYRVVLNIRADTHKPFQLDVFKDDKLDFSIRYMSYEKDIPFDASLFAPPSNVVITEAKPGS